MQADESIQASTLKHYQQILLREPKNVEAQIQCGNLCVELRRFEEAAGYFRRIERMAKYKLPAREALCFVLQEMGNAAHSNAQFVQAEACFEEALSYQPNNAEFWYNIGNAQRELGKLTAALNSFRLSIKFNSNDADAYNNCGNVQRELGQLHHAIASYERALLLKPDLYHALAHLVHQKQHICDWKDLDEQIYHLRQLVNTEPKAQISPFAFLSMAGTTDQEQKKCATNWANSFYSQLIQQHTSFSFKHFKTPQNPEQSKLKIGYLSADFRLHPLAYLITELIENSDKNEFETVAYSYGANDQTHERKRLEGAFDTFHDIKHLTDIEVAQKIHNDNVAILVDLTGFTQNSRTCIVALKPAPITINWLGFPGTMGEINGKPLFDYVISDKVISFNEAEMTEELIYLPCYQPNNSLRPVAKVTQKSTHNLPNNSYVYCCFNQSFKITLAVFEVWMRILQRTPNSVLWLLESNSWASANLRNEAEKAGIDSSRLIFAPRVTIAEHLERHIHADLFLDTSPYNAHTTASDALFMGLPLLTCIGDTFASRVAASLLQHINLPELIAQNWQEYEQKAIFYAQNSSVLETLKQQLAKQSKHSNLFNPSEFARNLEQQYQQIWHSYLAKTEITE